MSDSNDSTPDVGADVPSIASAATSPEHSFWTPERQVLLAWLENASPQLASVYAGAVVIATDSAFPGRVVFVWHAMREIRNRLPDALAGPLEGSSVQYGDLAAQIRRCWVDDGWPEDGSLALTEPSVPTASGPERHEVSRDMLVSVARLVAAHAQIGDRNQVNDRRLFESVAGTAVPLYAVQAWAKDRRRAHKLAHVHNKPPDPQDEASLDPDFSAFEAMLMVLANRSYENMDDLDEILASANR